MTFKKMSQAQLQRHIRRTALDTALVFLTTHAKKRMGSRKVLLMEVFECLRKGCIGRQPEEDMKTGHIVCHMERYVAGRDLTVCVALDDDNPDLVVVTVIA